MNVERIIRLTLENLAKVCMRRLGCQKNLIIELSYYGASISNIQKVKRKLLGLYNTAINESFMSITFP